MRRWVQQMSTHFRVTHQWNCDSELIVPFEEWGNKTWLPLCETARRRREVLWLNEKPVLAAPTITAAAAGKTHKKWSCCLKPVLDNRYSGQPPTLQLLAYNGTRLVGAPKHLQNVLWNVLVRCSYIMLVQMWRAKSFDLMVPCKQLQETPLE